MKLVAMYYCFRKKKPIELWVSRFVIIIDTRREKNIYFAVSVKYSRGENDMEKKNRIKNALYNNMQYYCDIRVKRFFLWQRARRHYYQSNNPTEYAVSSGIQVVTHGYKILGTLIL